MAEVDFYYGIPLNPFVEKQVVPETTLESAQDERLRPKAEKLQEKDSAGADTDPTIPRDQKCHGQFSWLFNH